MTISHSDPLQPRWEWEFDLAEATGSPVVKVFGHITREFGDVTFQISRIVTADGKSYDIEGEHDLPYVTDLDADKLETLEKKYA